ncbi:MAG: GntR family transcriptional regulator [Eubacteriales bacterium]
MKGNNMETFKELYDRTKATKRITSRLFISLKLAIINGLFIPETRINEIDLSKALDLNVNSLREALKMLEYENYITFNKGNGYYVKDISLNDLLNWFEMIKMITNTSAHLINTSEKTNMIMIKESLKYNHALSNFIMDKKFHITLAICSRNQQLVKTMNDLFDRMFWALNTKSFSDIPIEILNHHDIIADAIIEYSENKSENLKEKIEYHMQLHFDYLKLNNE